MRRQAKDVVLPKDVLGWWQGLTGTRLPTIGEASCSTGRHATLAAFRCCLSRRR